MKYDSPTDETNRSWTDLDLPSRVGRNEFRARRVLGELSAAITQSHDLNNVVHQSPQKRTYRMIAGIKSVIRYLRQNPQRHRLELVLPDRSWGSFAHEDLDEARIMRSQCGMYTESFHFRCKLVGE